MNRAQRRHKSPSQRRAADWERAKEEARGAAMQASYSGMASVLLAAHEVCGIGAVRMERILLRANALTNDALCAQELIDDLKAKVGIDLRFVCRREQSGLNDEYEE